MSIAAARLPKMMIIDESSAGAAAGMSAWSMATVSDAGAAAGAEPFSIAVSAAGETAAPTAELSAATICCSSADDAETIAALTVSTAAASVDAIASAVSARCNERSYGWRCKRRLQES